MFHDGYLYLHQQIDAFVYLGRFLVLKINLNLRTLAKSDNYNHKNPIESS